jgi:hypothetical protein
MNQDYPTETRYVSIKSSVLHKHNKFYFSQSIMFEALLAILVGVEVAQCREMSKNFKTIPTISSSLVNLGKMDISFHFNTKGKIVYPTYFI